MQVEYKGTGLVLRNYYPVRQKIALLDTISGRFDAFIDKPFIINICNGAIISYQMIAKAHMIMPRIFDVQQLHVPFEWANHDLGFLHHVLELCLRCVPIGSNADRVFEIVRGIYTMIPLESTGTFKKVIILHLLNGMGIHSDHIHGEDADVHALLSVPIENVAQYTVSEKMESMLAHLIISHLQAYIPLDQLYTMRFLTELDKHDE